MKPWRPYWKKLEFLQQELMNDAKPSPFSSLNEIDEWIQSLKFADLACADDNCDELIELLHNEHTEHIKYHLPNGDLRWQLILRCECAIDFCSGHLYDRKAFDWNQTQKMIYRWLLIDLWRREAAYWACKKFGSPKVRAVVRQLHLQKEIDKFFGKRNTNPTNN
jgi:hypothetical protein